MSCINAETITFSSTELRATMAKSCSCLIGLWNSMLKNGLYMLSVALIVVKRPTPKLN